ARGDGVALTRLRRAVVQEGNQGNVVETREEAEKGEADEERLQEMGDEGGEKQGRERAKGTEGNSEEHKRPAGPTATRRATQAAGEKADQRTTQADAQRHHADDLARLGLVPLRYARLAMHIHGDAHEGDDEGEEGNADDRQGQWPRTHQGADALPQRLIQIRR